jgi:hypothetical protein
VAIHTKHVAAVAVPGRFSFSPPLIYIIPHCASESILGRKSDSVTRSRAEQAEHRPERLDAAVTPVSPCILHLNVAPHPALARTRPLVAVPSAAERSRSDCGHGVTRVPRTPGFAFRSSQIVKSTSQIFTVLSCLTSLCLLVERHSLHAKRVISNPHSASCPHKEQLTCLYGVVKH